MGREIYSMTTLLRGYLWLDWNELLRGYDIFLLLLPLKFCDLMADFRIT